MIVLPRSALDAIARSAEAIYPEECCGLLVGSRDPVGTVVVSRVVAARNVAPSDRGRHFEVDPQVRFDLMRALREGGGREAIIGHYHSHPDHPACPSREDAAMAHEPDLIWLITAVPGGRAGETAAFRFDAAAARFARVPLVVR
ncbi:MAG: M67 family peptidase [Rhodospirillales bacterium]|nr:MAG: M67 family peptidase [Rhodospirillales bacterium]